MNAMKTLVTAFLIGVAMGGSAFAATITNKDAQSHILIVTEGGSKMEVAVDAGASVTICPGGCFVVMPSGDREALAGSEQIDIVNGTAVIK